METTYSLQVCTLKAPNNVNCLSLLHSTAICSSLVDAAADVNADVFAVVDVATLLQLPCTRTVQPTPGYQKISRTRLGRLQNWLPPAKA